MSILKLAMTVLTHDYKPRTCSLFFANISRTSQQNRWSSKRRSWTSALDHTSIPRLIYSRRSVHIFTTSSLSIVRHSDTLFIRIRLNYHQDRLELTLVLSTATAYLLNVRVGKQVIYLFTLLPLNAVVRSPIVKSCSFSAIYPDVPIKSSESGQFIE